MTVHWTNNAIAHLVDIYEYVARDSSIYAKRMVDRITKLLIEKPYRIIYRIKSEQVDVLAVVHCRQLLPKDI